MIITLVLLPLLLTANNDIFKIPQTCLLEEPITSQCILSLDTKDFIDQTYCNLCLVLAVLDLKNVASKEQQFCHKGWRVNSQCGYRYIELLLLKEDFVQAFIYQYQIFFLLPFNHDTIFNTLLQKHSKVLQHKVQGIEMGVDTLKSDFARAILFNYVGNFSSAENYLKNATEEGDLFYYRLFFAARLFEKTGKYTAGLEYVSQQIRKIKQKNGPVHGYIHHLKGNFLMHHLQFSSAIQQFLEANKNFLTYHQMHQGFSFSNYNLGVCHTKLNKFKQALPFYEMAYLQTQSQVALNALAMCHSAISQGDHPTQAKQHFQSILRDNPNNTLTLFNYAVHLLNNKSFSQAEKLLTHCISVDQQFKECRYGLIKVYHYTSNSALFVNQVQYFINKGQNQQILALLNHLERYESALQVAEKAQKLTASMKENYGIALFGGGRFQEAETTFEASIHQGNKNGHIYYNLGLTKQQLKKYQEALRAYQTSNKLQKRKQTQNKIQEVQKIIKSAQQL